MKTKLILITFAALSLIQSAHALSFEETQKRNKENDKAQREKIQKENKEQRKEFDEAAQRQRDVRDIQRIAREVARLKANERTKQKQK